MDKQPTDVDFSVKSSNRREKKKKNKRNEFESVGNLQRDESVMSERKIEVSEQETPVQKPSIEVSNIDINESLKVEKPTLGDESVSMGYDKMPDAFTNVATKILNNAKIADENIKPINIEKNDTLSSNYTLISFKTETVKVETPKINYKRWSEITRWLNYTNFEKKRNKYTFAYPYQIEQKDVETLENFISKIVNLIIQIANDYDFVILDDGQSDKIVSAYSQATGKRIVPNLNLSYDYNVEPVRLANEITLVGARNRFDAEEILARYLFEGQIRKDDRANIRRNIVIMLDPLSTRYLGLFARSPANFRLLPPDFLNGLYDYGTTAQTVINLGTRNVIQRPRPNGWDSVPLRSRSFVRRLTDQNNFIQVITRYTRPLIWMVTKFKAFFIDTYSKSIVVRYTDMNIIKQYFSQTEFGISRMRQTLNRTMEEMANATKAVDFLNNIISVITDPESYMIRDGPVKDFDPVWLLDTICFLYFFKPQVCTRSYASSIVRHALMCLANEATTIVNINITLLELLNRLAPFMNINLYNLFRQWINYANSQLTRADYIALYDNYGTLGGNNDNTGLLFWRRPAINLFRVRPQGEGDTSVTTNLINLFLNSPDVNTYLYSWFTTFGQMLGVAITGNNRAFTRTFYVVYRLLSDISASVLFINRFEIPKYKEIMVTAGSCLNFILCAEIDKMSNLVYNASDIYVWLNFEAYWTSKAMMLLDIIKSADTAVINYTGYSRYQNAYLKPWHAKWKLIDMLPQCMIKELLVWSYDNVNRIFSLDTMLNGAVGDFFRDLDMVFFPDRFIVGNTRWCVYTRVARYVLDFNNLGQFKLFDSFKIGKPSYIERFDGFRYKIIENNRIGMSIIFRNFLNRFGTPEFKRTMSNFEDTRTFIRVNMPTFVDFVFVKNFSEDESSFNKGEDVKKWLTTMKEPIILNDSKIWTARVRNEYISVDDVSYNENYFSWETRGVGCDASPFYTFNYDDTNNILMQDTINMSGYLEELTDQSGEFFAVLPTSGSLRLVFSTYV